MQTEIFMMDTGRTTKLMDLDNILIQMGHNMRAIGLTTSNMVKEKNIGQMALSMKAPINMVRKMVLVSSYGLISHLIVVLSLIIIFMDRENIDGQIIGNIQEIGSIIKCMEQVFLHGLMAENTKVNILMTKNKVMVCLLGQMEDNMMDIG